VVAYGDRQFGDTSIKLTKSVRRTPNTTRNIVNKQLAWMSYFVSAVRTSVPCRNCCKRKNFSTSSPRCTAIVFAYFFRQTRSPAASYRELSSFRHLVFGFWHTHTGGWH